MRYVLFAALFTGIAALTFGGITGFEAWQRGNTEPVLVGPVYEPNDPIYQLIPKVPEKWAETFGDNERSRVLHSISELRVVMAQLSRKVIDLEAKLAEVESADE